VQERHFVACVAVTFSNSDGGGWGGRVCGDEGRGESEVGDVFGFAAVAGALVGTASGD
jgi:hypothetical protein